MSVKGLAFKICKELLKLNNKNTNHLITKWAIDLNTSLTKDNMQMADKNLKRSSKSYVLRKLQINTTRYHCIPIDMAKIQNTDSTKCWQRCGATRTHYWRECRNSRATLDDSLAISSKAKLKLTIQSSNHTTWHFYKCQEALEENMLTQKSTHECL